MSDDKTRLGNRDVVAADVADWRFMLNALHGRFRTGGFATGLRLVTPPTSWLVRSTSTWG